MNNPPIVSTRPVADPGIRQILSVRLDANPALAVLRAHQLHEVTRAFPLLAIFCQMNAFAVAYRLAVTPFADLALGWSIIHALLLGWAAYAARRNARVPTSAARTGARVQRVAAGAVALALLWNGLLLAVVQHVPQPMVTTLSSIQLALIAAGAFLLAPAPLAALAFLTIFIVTHGLMAGMYVVAGLAPPHTLLLVAALGIAIGRSIIYQAQSVARQVAGREELRERGEVIRLLLNDYEANSSDWLWEVDADGRLTHVPHRFATLLGRAPEALLGEPLETALGGEAGRALACALDQRQSFRSLAVAVRSGDETRWWSFSASPIPGVGGAHGGFRGVGADITHARRNQEQIARMANSDNLTGLANRAAMRGHIQAALNRVDAEGCVVMMLDLDHFKAVNDKLGHFGGDELLREVARRLVAEVGQAGVVARLGGDEFAVILAHADGETARALAERCIGALCEPYAVHGGEACVGASAGIALSPRDGTTIDDLLRAADLALYDAKSHGRGVARLYDAVLQHNVEERHSLETALRSALTDDQLSLAFQPIVDLSAGGIVGFEALLRWRHPVLGQVSPACFIPVAEELGLMDSIGEWVIRTACAWAAQWPQHIGISVNLSPSQLTKARLPGIVLNALAMNGVAPERLELEVTEHVILSEDEVTRGALAQLSRLGVRIGLDDFGTGYSNFGYLRTTTFNTIKIDRSFVREAVDSASQSASIVRHIVSLAASLGMETVAEGAETQEELNAIRALGCGRVQGYFTGRPMSAEDATALVAGVLEARAA